MDSISQEFLQFESDWTLCNSEIPTGMLTLSIEFPIKPHKILGRVPLFPTPEGATGHAGNGTLTRMGWMKLTEPGAERVAIEVKVQEIKIPEGCSAYLFAVRWIYDSRELTAFTYQHSSLHHGVIRRPTVGENNDDVLQDQLIRVDCSGGRGAREDGFLVYILNRKDVDIDQYLELKRRGMDHREAYIQWR